MLLKQWPLKQVWCCWGLPPKLHVGSHQALRLSPDDVLGTQSNSAGYIDASCNSFSSLVALSLAKLNGCLAALHASEADQAQMPQHALGIEIHLMGERWNGACRLFKHKWRDASTKCPWPKSLLGLHPRGESSLPKCDPSRETRRLLIGLEGAASVKPPSEAGSLS